jgi:hypothetical protein
MIQFPNGFLVKCVGGYGKSSIYDLLIHYYDCIEIEDKDIEPNIVIILTEKSYGKCKELSLNDLKAKFLLGPQTKEELEAIKLCNVPLYTVAMNEVYKMYNHLNFPIYDYINLGLVLGAYKLSSKLYELRKDSDITLLNLKDSYISIEIEKNFSLRYSMMNENVRFVYESGISEIGTLLCMEWVKSLARNSKVGGPKASGPGVCPKASGPGVCPKASIYTIFDIDEEDLQGKNCIDFLIPFTILGLLQKGFLIVNSEQSPESLGHMPGPEAFDLGQSPESFDLGQSPGSFDLGQSPESFDLGQSPESFDSEKSFDFSLFNSLKSIWNSKEYIPRRKKLAEPLPDYQMFRTESNDLEQSSESLEPINFEECIRKPPIFIIDTLQSIKQWIQDHVEHFPEQQQIFVYVSRKKKF